MNTLEQPNAEEVGGKEKVSKIPTADIVLLIYTFCETLAGIKFFPYQAELVKRIIRSLLENDGEELTSLWSRQSGKSHCVAATTIGCAIILPVLAHSPMFIADIRFERFRGQKGLLVGIFAPAMHQSQIIFNKIKDFLDTESAQIILCDPDINVCFDTNNGENIVMRFGNFPATSTITCMSASDKSNIEGKTYMLTIVDESQDVGNQKYSKSIFPMSAFFNGTRMLIGTATVKRGFFYDSIEQNKKDHSSNYRKKCHFENDWRVVVKYNPNYEKHVKEALRKMGPDSDEFKMSYCVAPETRILTSDLRWVRADSLKRGDMLAGFDEESPKRYASRRFRKSIVKDVGRIKRPCYKLTFDDGTVVTCSSEHQWLTFTAGSRTEWTKTEDLVFTDRVYRPITPWKTTPSDYKKGYLAAAFEGEGHLSQINGKIGQVCFAQKDNVMLENVKQYLTDLGYRYSVRQDTRETGVNKLYLLGGRDAYFKFIGDIRPQRLLESFTINMGGTLRYCKQKQNGFSHPRLIAKEFVGEQEVIPIRTSTHTYIAEGLASHNCLQWVFERGMFVDVDTFEALGNTSLELFEGDKAKKHVAGIDLGKAQDSTVVTVMEPDWENPVIIEESKSPDHDDYVVYNTTIKAWMEIEGDNWEKQYQIILEFLDKWDLERVAIDATGVGSPMYDRLAPVLTQRGVAEVIPYVFTQQSKSALMKHFDSEMKAGRFQYPAATEVRETREYQRFTEQFINAEKSYSGSYLIVSHPNKRNAHDDYVFSAALASWASKGAKAMKVVSETKKLYNVGNDKKMSNYYAKRNKYTSRRGR